MQRISRLKREMQLLSAEPPPGISCWQTEGRVDQLQAQIVGGANTPYEGGVFTLEINIPERYPFEPPKMRFLTPVYHPNIDNAGRICLDALKLPPKGAWRPSLNISTVLTSIQLLMAEPNPDDPLMADISAEFKYNKPLYLEKAKKWTAQHAIQKNKGRVETEEKTSTENKNKKAAHKREALSAQENLEHTKKSAEFKYNKALYLEKAKKWTAQHAIQKNKGRVETEEKTSTENKNKKAAHKREAL